MAEAALDCFTALLDSIPVWIADLEGIAQNATERQKDMLRENQPVDANQNEPRKLSKASSVRTRRSQDSKEPSSEGLQIMKQDEPVPTLVRTQLPHMTQSDALRLAQRKRKTASVCSDRQSGPLKYRARSMVVVYYDGEIQHRFEAMVRAIGTRRNALRKGRTSAQVYELSRNASSGSEGSNGNDSGAYFPRAAFRLARLRQSPGAGSNEGLAAFDKLDGLLEQAQAQCERAAHQVLRDGDCGLEIQTAKERFAEARLQCEDEVPIWRKRIEEAAERERRSEERRRIEEEDEKKSPPDYASVEKVVDDPFSAPTTLEVDIDPDDSDGGGDESGRDFTINMMQLGRPRPYMRTTSLTAH